MYICCRLLSKVLHPSGAGLREEAFITQDEEADAKLNDKSSLTSGPAGISTGPAATSSVDGHVLPCQ